MDQTSLIQNEDNSANIANEQFDAIVIGSGIGGLTTASLLAQLEGKRVLVLERHFQIGGFTHSFIYCQYELMHHREERSRLF